MNYLALAFSLTFVLIPIILSKTLKLELEKDVVIATIRSIIQLFIVGYLLTFVFAAEHYFYILFMIMLMIGAATQNARKKGAQIQGITWKLIVTFVFVECLTQAILLGFNIIPKEAQYIIPLTGMVVGSSMVLAILFLNRFRAEYEARENEIELILSLGGTPKQAVHTSLISSIKASMIPMIESQKTIGLVQLPGMMSGQIIAGAEPLKAVQFQLLVLFLLLTTAAITSAMLGFLAYPTLFNERIQMLKLKNN